MSHPRLLDLALHLVTVSALAAFLGGCRQPLPEGTARSFQSTADLLYDSGFVLKRAEVDPSDSFVSLELEPEQRGTKVVWMNHAGLARMLVESFEWRGLRIAGATQSVPSLVVFCDRGAHRIVSALSEDRQVGAMLDFPPLRSMEIGKNGLSIQPRGTIGEGWLAPRVKTLLLGDSVPANLDPEQGIRKSGRTWIVDWRFKEPVIAGLSVGASADAVRNLIWPESQEVKGYLFVRGAGLYIGLPLDGRPFLVRRMSRINPMRVQPFLFNLVESLRRGEAFQDSGMLDAEDPRFGGMGWRRGQVGVRVWSAPGSDSAAIEVYNNFCGQPVEPASIGGKVSIRYINENDEFRQMLEDLATP